MRIANYKKPKFMFLENVKHILKVSKGEVFNYIVEKIKRMVMYYNYFKYLHINMVSLNNVKGYSLFVSETIFIMVEI